MLDNWIAFASDGASVMTGKKAGVATKLREKIPNLFTWHCLCHRLELSVHDVIKDCTGVSRFQSLMDKLYAYYHQSPKNSMGLDKSCVEVGIEMKKIGRVLNVRWSASSFRSIKAIWNNYPGIYLHSRKTTLMRAQSEINRTIRILESLKAEPGEKEKEIIEAIQKGINKGVNITMTKSGGINRLQFLQNLVDRMRQRLFDDSKNKTMLEDIQVIDEVFKVATNDAKGEDEVKRVSRTLGFSEFESVVDFRSRNVFSSFMKALNILPTSTADCERGFSDMNLTITDLRTRLNIENVSDLMFISINGPSVADFNPRPYIKIWLRDHRSAVSTPRGKERKEIDDENKMQKLFFNNLFN
ncbi:E3 SUMO-protein ligase KIAA1586-like [Metopolophium dirhodum]|uniref:E3 SUMO-protein ligase KIAA1586-like n=1 Tax=Metopolophium dirhodum TaxID=44670 RepID=UPI00299065C9|nr:E3 SUMO-protein ligase KIAA1586-like [Metopolophium dirhodum]